MMRAVIKNRMTGEEIAVTATTDHPTCSYGQALWADDNGTAYFQVGMANPIYEEDRIDTTTATREELGQLIRGMRISKGVSIRDMAERAACQPSTVQNVEKGSFTPRIDVIQRMLFAIGHRLVIK